MVDSTVSGWRRRAFGRGFLQRGPFVLLAGAALSVLALFGVYQFFFSGGITDVAQSRLLRHEHDDQLHVAYTVNRLKQQPPTGQTVYVFGGSGAMEAVVGDNAFAAQLTRRAERKVTVVGLANHAQSFAQNLVIVDNLPAGEAVLVIGIAPMRFNTAASVDADLLASRTLLLRSARLRKLAPELYGRKASWTGGLPGVMDFVCGYVRERLDSRLLPGKSLRYLKHYYGRGTVAVTAAEKRATLDDVWEYNRTNYAANHAYNLAVLRELVELAHDKGFRVVFSEQPLNTDIAGNWAGVLPQYRAAVGRIAEEYDIPYLRVDRSVRLGDEDFVDLYHLMPEARVRWQAQMAREVAEVLEPSSQTAARAWARRRAACE